MKGKTWTGGRWVVLGVLGVSLVAVQGGEPPPAAGTTNLVSRTSLTREVFPPGALVWRGPNAGLPGTRASGTNSASAGPALAFAVRLPPDLAEVLRMHTSGVGDEVILAHLQHSPPLSRITVDQVLYLKALGISPRLLTAMLEHQAAPEDTSAGHSEPTDESVPADSADSGFGAPSGGKAV